MSYKDHKSKVRLNHTSIQRYVDDVDLLTAELDPNEGYQPITNFFLTPKSEVCWASEDQSLFEHETLVKRPTPPRLREVHLRRQL
mmetsp:Transcript_104226/g.334351  ORF Transcript_104226/g.334351 Transcript_104226/m.334351 type:complete len:85 (+) Transcript_104226:574-828(+)